MPGGESTLTYILYALSLVNVIKRNYIVSVQIVEEVYNQVASTSIQEIVSRRITEATTAASLALTQTINKHLHCPS